MWYLYFSAGFDQRFNNVTTRSCDRTKPCFNISRAADHANNTQHFFLSLHVKCRFRYQKPFFVHTFLSVDNLLFYVYWGVPLCMAFWCGSGSADPCLWILDPDLDPDPAIFVTDLQDAIKKQFKKKFFSLLLFEGTVTSFFKDKKSKRSHKTVGIKVFSFFLIDDWRIGIWIWIHTCWLMDPDPDPGGPKNISP